jgi:serine/tyrosine/threonine adenylyltransferase
MNLSNHYGPDQFGFCFDNSYSKLPEALFARANPKKFKNPSLVILNQPFANTLGLDTQALKATDWACFSGRAIPEGAYPIAQAYAGHQFGGFNNLGDGRAILLGEHIAPSHQRFDIQLKGSGPTPYSRSGDGLAGLGPMLREFLMSEAMHGLGVPTTRSLAVMLTGEVVYRAEPSSGAVLTRVAASHIRVGTFQYVSAIDDINTLKSLADYTINRHYPALRNHPQPYIGLLEAVIDAQALLIAKWMQFGFIHGVMNTDNMSIAGETIDYGPCAFVNTYSPKTVFSSIDKNGRYAFGNQPMMGEWNLTRFAESLLPLLAESLEEAIGIATEFLNAYQTKYRAYWLSAMRKKIGLFNDELGDLALVEDLLMLMYKHQADYTNTFRNLSNPLQLSPQLIEDGGFKNLQTIWHERLSRQSQTFAEVAVLMDSHNPIVIPRNHLVEEVLENANQGDMGPFHDFLDVLSTPYQMPKNEKYLQGPAAGFDASYRTFCGT